jgi:hydroxymethylbilane synthase
MKKILRLGTRGSPLALVQAEIVRSLLQAAHAHLQDDADIEIVPIRTTGDWRPEQREQTFLEMGGNKGLFTKEIEEALQAGYIDFAVHSMKDVQTWTPDGLEYAAILPRGDPRDAFIAHQARSLQELPAGAIVGTSSLRRQSQILAKRPDLKVVPLRGNVDTRLKKLMDGEADATMLAVAGLVRLGLEHKAASILDTQTMLPAVAQGAVGVEIRSDDDLARELVTAINCAKSMACVAAERALLKVLDGSCRTPIAALAQYRGTDKIYLEGLVAKPDGSAMVRLQQEAPPSAALQLGEELGHGIKRLLPLDFFAT